MNIKSQPGRKPRKYLIGTFLIAFAWVAVQLLLFRTNGINTEGESEKYISEAHRLVSGEHLSSLNFYFYSVVIVIIAISLKINAGFFIPLAIQLLLNLFATFTFYKWASKNFDSTTGLVATLCLIAFFPYQEFNTFLQTESVYYSLIIILSCFLFSLEKINLTNVVKLTFLLLLLTLTRPSGILFIPCVAGFLYIRFIKQYAAKTKFYIAAATSIIFMGCVQLIMTSGGEFDFILPFIQEHIICGVPTVTATNTSYGSGLPDLIRYIFNNGSQVLSLAGRRSIAFFGLSRTYYSFTHNMLLIAVFWVLYVFAISGLKLWWRKDRAVTVYLISTIFITWLTAMLTCDDWHNRFILALYPALISLALPAGHKLRASLTKMRI